MPTYRLRNLKLDRVDMVDAGAGVDKRGTGEAPAILLLKRAGGAPEPKTADETAAMLRDLVKRLPRIQKEMYLDGAVAAPPASFDDVMLQRTLGSVTDALSTDVWALYDSLCGILRSDVADKGARLRESLAQFLSEVETELGDWTAGDVEKAGRKISGARMKMLKEMYTVLGKMIDESEPVAKPAAETPTDEGGEQPMDKTAKADKTTVEAHVLEALAELGIAEPTVAQVEKVQARLPRTAAPKDPADVLKSLAPEARSVIEKIQADLVKSQGETAEALSLAKAEREQRVQSEYITKSAKFAKLGVKADDDWSVLREVDEKLSEPAKKRMHEILNGAVAKIDTVRLFGTQGVSGDVAEPDSAIAKIDQLVTARMADVTKNQGGKLTPDKALEAVFQEHPELYAAYRAETSVKVAPGKS